MKHKAMVIGGVILLLLFFMVIILIPVSSSSRLKKIVSPKGVIAIVIDDWGYHLDNLAIVRQIKSPLTCAILPNLKNSNYVARQLHNLNFEIILHLPMEPKERHDLEQDTLTTTMDRQRLSNILDRALASVSFAKGINNHMGSRVTEDKKAMSLIMAEVKKRKLYFLDSFVTAKSVCRQAAAESKVKFGRRDVFLDNQNDPEYIRGQLLKLKDLAQRQMFAIGIGHDRKNTLKVLAEMLPRLESEGYKLALVSELVQ